jgi:signal transduction histidine kinase
MAISSAVESHPRAMAWPSVRDYGWRMAPRAFVDRFGDVLLAAVSAALFLLQIATEDGYTGERPQAAAVALMFSGSLAWRRRRPRVPLLAGIGLMLCARLGLHELGNSGVFFVGYVLAIYAAGRHASGRDVAANAAVVGVALVVAVSDPSQPFSLSDAAFLAVAFAGPFLAGRGIRRRLEREQLLEGRAVDLERERDVRAREAVAHERARIARELHDVVAHAISVMVLQARGGRRKLPAGADETRVALDEIERAGEQALAEMRRLLGMLREDDEQLALAPQPSLARIDELLSSLAATGLPVELTIEGEPFDLPPGVDVSAFRIVQEALTNALKHAGPARAHVTLRYSPADLQIEIVDDGRGNGHSPGTGHGLAGIRERVAIYGGDLQSGRRTEGGYALRVRLPLGGSQ